ncbi:MFS transporter [Rhodococcus sp. BP-349]|nr:MFS transporter [Rhodococcus sp. BP-363]MBY6544310.1 MFS transporter [Rhodococcus sp. BP-369]MBY6563540.1 MFS transporter [Rhodococcus sp. BP-370]MBY6577832.1 MFS transporter [Rhodococcus sp. BP-364]MBY6587133.1 MFS transporter [Rhodococcus sp. BP-358]MBY6591470.1 MFS transporter [Rhodococcus sp. BP-362]MBY6595196.1 MFS transporter [Rhodococcus sp. BP-359]MBY6599535.1 MFS transporter [Rhodococcus sp. BP-353]MBY6603872.1 MFS transporter [Rhodococcus sp. BP-351]MBY6608209.1 MFS transporte
MPVVTQLRLRRARLRRLSRRPVTSPPPTVPLSSARGRWIVLATVLGSTLSLLDGTVVTIALPDIGTELGADVSGLQWTVTGYTLTLAAFVLLGGSLGDRVGRRRIFVLGTIWFAVASVACGLAPNVEFLVLARVVQGIGAALVTPGSLAILSASIDPKDRGAAIGLWSGFGGIGSAVGPLLGGWLVEIAGWRSIFLLNVPLAVAVVVVALRHVPETRDPETSGRLDLPGAAVVALALAALTYGAIDGRWPIIAIGLVGMAVFVVVERRTAHPLVPPSLFSSRVFVAANIVTFAAYAALGGVFFLLLLQLQVALGYSALAAGTATLPITAALLLLSARAGALAGRIGPRLPMTVGPLVAAVGLVLMIRIEPGSTYLGAVLPAVVVFGVGLSLLVAPLTAAVIGAAPASHAGTASAVNNAVARTAQLLSVAAIPGIVGISGQLDPAQFSSGFRAAMLICAAMLALAGALAAVSIRTPRPTGRTPLHCDVSGPPVTDGR